MNVVSVKVFSVVFTKQCLLVLVCSEFLFVFSVFFCFIILTMAVLEPFSQIKKKKQNLFSFRGLFYIYVSYFYIFFYRYLLHIVVYITVV